MSKRPAQDYAIRIKFPVWFYTVHVIFTDDLRRSKKARYGTDEGISDQTNAVHCWAADECNSHLFFRHGASARTVAHESLHAVQAMFRSKGVTKMDDETASYHLGYIVDKVVAFQQIVENALAVKSSGRRPKGHERNCKAGKKRRR